MAETAVEKFLHGEIPVDYPDKVQPRPWHPHAWYNEFSDALQFYFKPDPFTVDRAGFHVNTAGETVGVTFGRLQDLFRLDGDWTPSDGP